MLPARDKMYFPIFKVDKSGVELFVNFLIVNYDMLANFSIEWHKNTWYYINGNTLL